VAEAVPLFWRFMIEKIGIRPNGPTERDWHSRHVPELLPRVPNRVVACCQVWERLVGRGPWLGIGQDLADRRRAILRAVLRHVVVEVVAEPPPEVRPGSSG
jgi:hypothetical protein